MIEKGADVSIGNTAFVTETKINTTDKSEFDEAIKAAKDADVVVMVLGEIGFQFPFDYFRVMEVFVVLQQISLINQSLKDYR